jgi:hypothetical protein
MGGKTLRDASSMGTNRLLLTLSVSAIAVASLAYCLAPRLGAGVPPSVGPSAVALTAADRAPALTTYRDAMVSLSKGEDAAARALLSGARGQEIVITRFSSVDTPLGEMSGASLMMDLSGKICARALAAAKDHDRSGALDWIQQANLLAGHILGTNAPTLDAFLAARAVDQKALRTEVAVLRQLGAADEADRAFRRESALDHFCATRVTPLIRAAVADHLASQQEAPMSAGGRRPRDAAAVWQAVDRRDEARAENLIVLYRRERQRVAGPQ